MQFRDVHVGQWFTFTGPPSKLGRFAERNCKTSATAFRDSDGEKFQVGTVAAAVERVSDEMECKSGYRDRICSSEQLKMLCELLQWANASDADETVDRPSAYSLAGYGARRGFYGHIWDSIMIILDLEAGISSDALGDPNFGGGHSWYEDLLDAVDEAKYTFTPHFTSGDRG